MNIKHINFAVLILILGVGIATFLSVASDTNAQMWVVGAMSVCYVLWGIIYHAMEGDLHRKVILEYFLIAAIVMIVFATVLWT